jgi:hypothetical protein
MIREVQIESYNGDWLPYGPHKKPLITSVIWNKDRVCQILSPVCNKVLNHVKLGASNVAYLIFDKLSTEATNNSSNVYC